MQGIQAPESTKTTTEVKNTIQETSDFKLFKLLPHNRPVVQSHVARLSQSLADRPHLRPARPVLVNEKYQVIDGQHRLRASELNGQTVFFMVVPGLTIDDARLLNALQRTWSILDYAYSYASSRVPAYVQFVKAYEAHELPPSIILEAMMGRGAHRDNFRIGKLVAIDQQELETRLLRVQDVITAFPDTVTPYVVSAAFLLVEGVEGYDHERFVNKLQHSRPQPQKDRNDYIREMERIYNADVPFNGPSYVRFFGS